MSVTLILSTLAAGTGLGLGILRCVRTLHMHQLDGYSTYRLLRWLAADPSRRAFDAQAAACHILFLFGALFVPLGTWGMLALLGGASVCGIALLVDRVRRASKPKRGLVYTGRALRILVGSMLICGAIVGAGLWRAFATRGAPVVGSLNNVTLSVLLATAASVQLAPLAVVLANLLLFPVQSAINAVFLWRAKVRLRKIHPIVVGITGSFGKTSTKVILARLLSLKLRVCSTPKSFNTLMGVCKVINEDLRDGDQVLVVEMGAYRRGDIRELCELVKPTLGILTAVGPQHLERFRTFENIKAAKYELIESLPGSGLAIVNGDDRHCREIADRTNWVPVMRFGMEDGEFPVDFRAGAVRQSPDGLAFEIIARGRGHVAVRTRLLGRHNVMNILAAVAAAESLGVSLESAAEVIEGLEPVPHRLQIVRGTGGILIIDDSYNANASGAFEALEVLRTFAPRRRILVTPGIVELGSLEQEVNERLGARAAEICDVVILVGAGCTHIIRRGLQASSFPAEQVHAVSDLAGAREILSRTVRPGDVVLFENDLPDLYA